MSVIALGLISAALLACFWRISRGPSIADRLGAAASTLILATLALAFAAAQAGDAVLALASLAFFIAGTVFMLAFFKAVARGQSSGRLAGLGASTARPLAND